MLPQPSGVPIGAGARGWRPGLVVVVVLLALLFVPLPRTLSTPVFRHAFDFGHVPLFAALFLVLFGFLKPRVGRAASAAALLSAALAAVSEVLQLVTSRSGSLADFGLDLVGVGLAWSGVVAWSRSIGLRLVHAVAVGACVAAAALGVSRTVARTRELAAMMPLLAGFERPFELDRWHAKEGTIMRRVAPGHAGSGWALEVRCSADTAYPGVSIEDFEGDWRGYRWLEWSVRVPSDEPLELSVRLDDDQGALHGTRYTESVRVVPPQRTYRIDLSGVAAHFRDHPMNMGVITELHFFLDEPRGPREFSLDEVRLVR